MRAMVLAAGYGKRMRPLTDHTPKPLLTVADKPLIVYHLEKLKAAGVEQVVINTGWLGAQIPAMLGDGQQFGLNIAYSPEPSPLETAGGIRNALPLLGEQPFWLVNGDIWTDYAFERLPKTLDGLAHLVMVDNPAHNRDGDFALCERGVVSESGSRSLTYGGVACISPTLLTHYDSQQPRLAPLLRAAMADHCVTGEYHAGQWWDIGTPERLQALDSQLRLQHG